MPYTGAPSYPSNAPAGAGGTDTSYRPYQVSFNPNAPGGGTLTAPGSGGSWSSIMASIANALGFGGQTPASAPSASPSAAATQPPPSSFAGTMNQIADRNASTAPKAPTAPVAPSATAPSKPLTSPTATTVSGVLEDRATRSPLGTGIDAKPVDYAGALSGIKAPTDASNVNESRVDVSATAPAPAAPPVPGEGVEAASQAIAATPKAGTTAPPARITYNLDPKTAAAGGRTTTMEAEKPIVTDALAKIAAAAPGFGLDRITVTGGGGPGGSHVSHKYGTEMDIVGYNADGSPWTDAQRLQVANVAASLGAGRFGLYPGGALHFGFSDVNPHAAWGPGGKTSGVGVGEFDPVEQDFAAWAKSGQPYSAYKGGSRFEGVPGAVDPFANATTYGAGGPATGGNFERDPNGNPVPPANIPPMTIPPGTPHSAGMINKNPGNLQYSGSEWQKTTFPGIVGPSGNLDAGKPQIVFDTQENGMTAAATLAIHRGTDNGLNTVEKLVGDPKFGLTANSPLAPGAIVNISKAMGVKPGDVIDMSDPATAKSFMRAYINQEHGAGAVAYTDDFINAGVDRALGRSGGAMPRAPGGIDYSIPGAGFGQPEPVRGAPVSPVLASAPPAASLRMGASGPGVKELQQQLLNAGFNPGPIDGQFGQRTRDALFKFQQTHPGTGTRFGQSDAVAGPKTRAALAAATAGGAVGREGQPVPTPRERPGAPLGVGAGPSPYGTFPPEPGPSGTIFPPGGGMRPDQPPVGERPITANPWTEMAEAGPPDFASTLNKISVAAGVPVPSLAPGNGVPTPGARPAAPDLQVSAPPVSPPQPTAPGGVAAVPPGVSPGGPVPPGQIPPSALSGGRGRGQDRIGLPGVGGPPPVTAPPVVAAAGPSGTITPPNITPQTLHPTITQGTGAGDPRVTAPMPAVNMAGGTITPPDVQPQELHPTITQGTGAGVPDFPATMRPVAPGVMPPADPASAMAAIADRVRGVTPIPPKQTPVPNQTVVAAPPRPLPMTPPPAPPALQSIPAEMTPDQMRAMQEQRQRDWSLQQSDEDRATRSGPRSLRDIPAGPSGSNMTPGPVSSAIFNQPPERIMADMASMPHEQRVAARGDIVASVMDAVAAGGPNVVGRIEASPVASRQLAAALGPDKAREFTTMLRVQAGGPQLGQRLVAAAPAARVDPRVAASIGRMLASEDPGDFARAVRLVAANKPLSGLLRQVSDQPKASYEHMRDDMAASASPPRREIVPLARRPDAQVPPDWNIPADEFPPGFQRNA